MSIDQFALQRREAEVTTVRDQDQLRSAGPRSRRSLIDRRPPVNGQYEAPLPRFVDLGGDDGQVVPGMRRRVASLASEHQRGIDDGDRGASSRVQQRARAWWRTRATGERGDENQQTRVQKDTR